ncbi:juvenile hormone esterase-like [Vespa crabro]|uniref:juvenile hormone esterase-like n=1 Tax=Vespa crabro TaxID=7445 RepID=UPI001F028B02|nr:juvenile hormone esterase-like [Vespa crabro]XP_046835898.1 juvenile hormone esterase-like [Vespa crabro]
MDHQQQGPVLSLKQGKIQGVIKYNVCSNNDNYLAFQGIPYAKPPIGELRFQDPLPAEGWNGIRDGSKFGNISAQIDVLSSEIIGSDDCLYLNVYKPKRIEMSIKLPVMVWIHGGGFYLGSGNDDMYSPDYIIRKDIILVTINYRLGVLGFLNLEDEVAPGNQGLKDQVMALRWVRDNIEVFGGDPQNVTIFGGSAGAASVHYLTISPLAEGLFHKAIAQSGLATNSWASTSNEPRRYGYQLSAMLGFKSFDPKAVVDFLRKVEIKMLIKYQSYITSPKEKLRLFSAFLPGVDYKSKNPFLTQSPEIAIKLRSNVPFMLGFNSMEGSFFMSTTKFASSMLKISRRLNANIKDLIPPSLTKKLQEKNVTINDVERLYFGEKSFNHGSSENIMYFLGDLMFTHHIFELARILPKINKYPVFLYQFSYMSTNTTFLKTALDIQIPGATHGDELFYMFYGKLQEYLSLKPLSPGTKDYKIMEYFTQLWTDFAKTGNPTPTTTELIPVLWEPLEKNGNEYNYFNIDENLRMESIPIGKQRFEWNTIPKNNL